MDMITNATDAAAMAMVVVVDWPMESPSFPEVGGATTKESRPLSKKLAEATAGAKSAMYSSSASAALIASYASFFAAVTPVSRKMVVEPSMTVQRWSLSHGIQESNKK